ncbi:hypothetical protein AHYW_002199 [Providencia manganoxydans]
MRGVNQNVTLSRVEWCVLATMTPILCVGLSVFALYAVKQPLFGMSFENKAASAEGTRLRLLCFPWTRDNNCRHCK